MKLQCLPQSLKSTFLNFIECSGTKKGLGSEEIFQKKVYSSIFMYLIVQPGGATTYLRLLYTHIGYLLHYFSIFLPTVFLKKIIFAACFMRIENKTWLSFIFWGFGSYFCWWALNLYRKKLCLVQHCWIPRPNSIAYV